MRVYQKAVGLPSNGVYSVAQAKAAASPVSGESILIVSTVTQMGKWKHAMLLEVLAQNYHNITLPSFLCPKQSFHCAYEVGKQALSM